MLPSFEDLFEHAPCGYLVLSPEGVILKANDTFCKLSGFAKPDIAGKRLRELLTPGSSIFYETHFAPLLRMQGYFNEVALDLRSASGERLPVLANAVEDRQDGNLVTTRVALFAAPQRRKYERELLETRKALTENWKEEKAMGELREQFIAVLGHDLRNPLAGFIGGINLLLRREQPESSLHVLRLMQASAIRMGGLIDNLLDFARARLGAGMALTLDADAPLAPTLLQVISEIQAAHPDRTIESVFALDAPISVDHARLAQLFSNLLGNAITHGDPDQPIRVEAGVTDGQLYLTVANSGAPIPADTMPHLFQPFYRGQVRPSQQGLGLGLFIAEAIAKAHGGRIEVSSNAAETRFTFVIPASAEA